MKPLLRHVGLFELLLDWLGIWPSGSHVKYKAEAVWPLELVPGAEASIRWSLKLRNAKGKRVHACGIVDSYVAALQAAFAAIDIHHQGLY